jgi:hypothetical protein
MSPKEQKTIKGGTMHIVLKNYLERLEQSERVRPAGERRRVPYVTLNKIANNNISQLSLETGGKIISAVRRFGFEMTASDFVTYIPES